MRDPASVAAQLLAFHAEPVRHRGRLTHGREILPGGALVFRFAQGKFPEKLARKLPPEEQARIQAAAAFFVRQVCFWDGATHYQVLCVPPDAPMGTIREHYQALVALIHPDRAVQSEEHWPADFAQRVNRAWAVLSTENDRRRYDATISAHGSVARPMEGMESHGPEAVLQGGPAPRRGAPARRMRLRTTVAATSVALAGLFFAFAWWASHVPSEYATLQGATRFDASLQWMRDVGSSTRLPGFLGVSVARPAQEAGEEAVTAKPARAPAGPLIAVSAEVNLPAESAPAPVRLAREEAIAPAAPVAPAPSPEPTQRTRPERSLVAEAARQPAAAAPQPANPVDAALPELEVLVTRFIALYERGDLDRLLALFDAESLGVMEAWGVRSDFEDFFKATHARRLRIQRLDWSPTEAGFRGRGQATVEAQYRDASKNLERPVNVGMDVVMRGGRPSIARLSLYPHE